MIKKKIFNRIFLTTVIFFIVFSFYNLNLISSSKENNIKNNNYKKESIYTLNNDNYISKTDVYVSKEYSLEEKIKEKLEIMIKDNNKNSLLPSYFNPILPENTQILDVIVRDSIVKVYFSKELNNITEEQSEKMIEAIIYTIEDNNVLGIEIYVEGKLLKYVPHTNKELPALLTKDFGINKTYELIGTNDIVKIVMMYYSDCDDKYCEIPVTKYLNDNREKLEIIFEDLSNTSNNNLISLFDGVKLINYNITKDSITINLSNDIDREEMELLIGSIENNYDISKINILVNNQKKFTKTIEK